MLTVDTIADEASLVSLTPEWEVLDASLSPRTPFSAPAWCLTWWRHFRRDGLWARDAMRVLTVRRDGALVAVAPMMLTARPAVGPIRTRELQFFGADPYLTEVRGPVCRGEDMPAVIAALRAHLRETDRDWDWVQWRGLRKAEPDAPWDGAALTLSGYSELQDHYLTLPADWDSFRSSLPRNIKESLRKCYNSLSRDGHAFQLKVAASPDEVETALETFLDLHRMRAATTGTIDHLDVFQTPASRSFLRDWGRSLAERDELRVFQLVIEGKVVATRIGVVLGDELYLYYSGYDVGWGRYSVMTTTVAEAIRWAIANGFAIVNLSTGSDVAKLRWRPKQAVFAAGYQVSPTLKSRIAFASIDSLRRRGQVRPAPAAGA